jgi:hypothetical protein
VHVAITEVAALYVIGPGTFLSDDLRVELDRVTNVRVSWQAIAQCAAPE